MRLTAFVARRRTLITGATLFVVAAAAFHLARSAIGYWGIDDAGITYAQALELADHHSFAANIEGTPVEGYSNPLVFFLVALLRWAGCFNPVTTHIALETIVFAAMVTLVWALLASIANQGAAVAGAIVFAVVELVTPATWIWYGSGLENVWVSAGLVALLVICARTARGIPLSAGWGAFAFLVAITRPEGPAYVAAFYAALILARPSSLSSVVHVRRVAVALAVTIALYLVFLGWRRYAYGAWLPNTYYTKLHEPHALGRHLRDYVWHGILPYTHTWLFVSAIVGVLACERWFGMRLALISVASLALPIVAGMDWMGEHRFATPFLAMAHLSYASFVAICVHRVATRRKLGWSLGLVATVGAGLLLLRDRLAVKDSLELNNVTIGLIAQGEGGLRWEQQFRMGVPYAVVQIPDAGGTLLVGAMQMLDNGYLTDFQMSRIGRVYTRPPDRRVLNQYQHEERRPDLMTVNNQFALDRSYLGTRYLAPSSYGVLYVRGDLVTVASVDPSTVIFDDGMIRIAPAPDTVPIAGPSGLVRFSLVVGWRAYPEEGPVTISATVEQGDRDQISFVPSSRAVSGLERNSLLLGMPAYPGRFAVSMDVTRGGRTVHLPHVLTVEVTDNPTTIASAAARYVSSFEQLAWLREQFVPRLGMTAFHARVEELAAADLARAPSAGQLILTLRDNARLGELRDLPTPIPAAEIVARITAFERCASQVGTSRIVCLGRTVDRLRRYGYLGTLAYVPPVAAELAGARERLAKLSPAERYCTLVGLTLAIPEDVSLQWQILRQRRALAQLGDLPACEGSAP